FYPGTSLAEKYQNHFFLCDFRGSAGGSGVWAFTNRPKGASFELVDQHEFVWSVLATDCEFGPAGGLYVSGWVAGGGLPGKGRIYRVADTEAMKKPVVAEVKKLRAEGFDKRPAKELLALLEHPDQRVRQGAQFALVAHGGQSGTIDQLGQVAA